MPGRYEPKSFEEKWRKRWLDAGIFATREDPSRPKFYGLDFFPYPSGAGLSVGHCRNYVPTDVLCRMKYMQGFNVLHPMGFDAFGLPAENEAIDKKTHPAPMVKSYGENYHRQMDLIGVSFDWSRSFYSSDPEFYRWTQWIFRVLYEKGLAYRKLASVNWCPKDRTVLADEEVEGGLCWRCGTPVEKKWIPQWFFRITAYADRLLADLEEIDWPEGIKEMQRNWIGKSEGVEFSLSVELPGGERRPAFQVFTTRIDTVFGMTFCVLAPEHELVETLTRLARGSTDEAVRTSAERVDRYVKEAARLTEADRLTAKREKTGEFTGFFALNPVNGERVPIWVADYVLASYGTGAIMAVPGHDERDFEFAQKFGLEVRRVIAPSSGGESDWPELPWTDKEAAVLVNSGEFDGLPVQEAQRKLGEWFEAKGQGVRKDTYRLRDWLISRQRFWGCPIPIYYDSEGAEHVVPESELPVLLPEVARYDQGEEGRSPLADIPEFAGFQGEDGRAYTRETDTMGGFACSSWYFLRYCDPRNSDGAWDASRVSYWMPVDCYVGGAEHAVMHLLYARFWTKVLYDEGLVPVKEPFARLMNQGQVLARTPYRKPRPGERLEVGEEGILITFEEAKEMQARIDSGELPEDELMWRWARMSKSKGNVVTPDEMVEQYGADALRVFELFVAPFDADVHWDSSGVEKVGARFLDRVFRTVHELSPLFDPSWRGGIANANLDDGAASLRRATHQAIKKSTEDIGRFAFNTYVAALMSYLNAINDFCAKRGSSESASGIEGGRRFALSESLETLVLLIAPAAPFSADELWESLGDWEGKAPFTYLADWPEWDPELAKEDVVTIAVQVNGKLRDTLEMPAGASNEELERAALASPKVLSHMDGKGVKKVIVVPGKLVNVVVG